MKIIELAERRERVRWIAADLQRLGRLVEQGGDVRARVALEEALDESALSPSCDHWKPERLLESGRSIS